MYTGLILTLTNNSGQTVAGTFDGQTYSVSNGATISLPDKIATWVMDKNPGKFAITASTYGVIPDESERVTLTNTSGSTISGVFGGQTYIFQPNVAAAVTKAAADYFTHHPTLGSSFTRGILALDKLTTVLQSLSDAVAAQVGTGGFGGGGGGGGGGDRIPE